MSKVISMADRANDARFNTPVQMLESAKTEIESGEGFLAGSNAALLIGVIKVDGEFSVCYRNSKLSSSEIIAACEIIKARMLQNMGIVPECE